MIEFCSCREADDRVRSAVRDVIVSLTMNMMAQYEDEQQEVGAVQQPHFWPELLQALWTYCTFPQHLFKWLMLMFNHSILVQRIL